MSELQRAYHFARCLRMSVVAVCRGAVIVLAFGAAATLVAGAIWFYQNRPLMQAGMMPSSEAYDRFYIGMGQLVSAVLLAAFGALIARWLVPAPKAVCLRCGYSTEKLTSPKCPECGHPCPSRTRSATTNDRVACAAARPSGGGWNESHGNCTTLDRLQCVSEIA